MLIRHHRDRIIKRILPWIAFFSAVIFLYSIYSPYYDDYNPETDISLMNQKWLQKEIFSYISFDEDKPEEIVVIETPTNLLQTAANNPFSTASYPRTTSRPTLTNTTSTQTAEGKFVKKTVHLRNTKNAMQDLIARGVNHNLIKKLKPLYGQLEAPYSSVTLLYADYVKNGKTSAVNSKILAVKTNKWTYYGKHTSQGYMFFDENGNAPNSVFDRKPFNYVRISSPFNPRRLHPITRRVRPHRGVDLKGAYGTPIHATADGVVTYAGWMGGYGRIVIVAHRGGYETRYAHLSAIKVSKGARIKRGAIVGNLGNSGASTGAHLHYEVRINGEARDPLTVKLPTSYRLRQQDLPAWRREIAEYKQALGGAAAVKTGNNQRQTKK